MKPLVFSIPAPPSLNASYRNVKNVGRVKTSDYKSWFNDVVLAIKSKKLPQVAERCSVRLIMPDSFKGDIDNRLKPTLDVMVKAGVLQGDQKKYVRSVSAEWSDKSGDDALVIVSAA